jgi:hypothetical protein
MVCLDGWVGLIVGWQVCPMVGGFDTLDGMFRWLGGLNNLMINCSDGGMVY